MTNELSQTGSGNLAFQNIENSTLNVHVENIIVNSYQYNEMLERLQELEKSLAKASSEDVDWLSELNKKIAEQNDQIRQFKQGVLQLAETFSRIDVDTTDRLKRAREFFEKGEFGEARAVMEVGLEQMNDDHTRLLEQKEKLLPKLKHNAEEFLVLAQTTAMNFDSPNRFEDTCRYYEQSIAAHPLVESLFNYAKLLKEHNQFHLAEPCYRRVLNEFRDELSREDYAATLNNQAILHKNRNEYQAAEKEYTEALAIYRELADKNPQTYLSDAAMTLNNLAVLHRHQNEFEAAESKYADALQIYRELTDKNPQVYLFYVARTLNNLANLHGDRNEFEVAEAEFTEALAIYRKLAEKNPEAYLPDVAMTLNNLAILHRNRSEFEAAEKEYAEALEIRRELAEKNRQAYMPNVATTLHNLAVLHRARNKHEAAEEEYTEALAIRRELAGENPEAYLPDVAHTLNNLAVLHRDQSEQEAAEAEYIEALKIYRGLAEKNPQAYLPNVAMTLINQALFYQENEPDKERSTALAIEAVCIIQPFVDRAPYTQRYLNTALAVLKGWGLTDEEIEEKLAKYKLGENL